MSIASLLANRAYSEAIKNPALETGNGLEARAEKTNDFSNLVSDYLGSAIETGKTSEAVAQQALTGQADMIDVVTAISAAETTLETVVAVRDKVISAYESIIRMPI